MPNDDTYSYLDKTGLEYFKDKMTDYVDSHDSADETTTFTSGDDTDANVTTSTGWSAVTPVASTNTHANLFQRISLMMKNVRWLYKMLGTTDISTLSSAGTVTGALAKLNTDSNNSQLYRSTISSITSDVYLRELQVGIYRLTTTAESVTYCPVRYGVLEIIKTDTYSYAKVVSTANQDVYIRTFTSTGWHTGWILLPTRTEVNRLTSNTFAFDNAGGSAIPANTDLNDVTILGAYYCNTSEIATTYSNCPVNSGFRMLVTSSGYGNRAYSYQIIICGGSINRYGIYVRRRSDSAATSSATWDPWQRVTGTSVDTVTITSGSTATITAIGGSSIMLNILGYSDVSTGVWMLRVDSTKVVPIKSSSHTSTNIVANFPSNSRTFTIKNNDPYTIVASFTSYVGGVTIA